jgi:drug/metabolite transporter (DMT)-like permease
MRNAYLLLHFSVILAGFTGVFGKLISLNEGMIAWYRVFFSAIILFFVVKLFRINTNIKRKEKFDIGLGIFLCQYQVFQYICWCCLLLPFQFFYRTIKTIDSEDQLQNQ